MFNFRNKEKNKAWFFSNENIALICEEVALTDKDILGIGGAGDQGLSFLSQGARSYRAVDKRRKAIVFLKLKKAMVSELSYEKFLRAFSGEIKTNVLLDEVEAQLSDQEKYFWRSNLQEDESFLSALKQTGFFYNHSFRGFQNKNFFPYLQKKGYKKVKSRISALNLQFGSISSVLEEIEQSYDYVYLSNVLDSFFQHQFYIEDFDRISEACKKALGRDGQVLLASLLEDKLKSELKERGWKVESIYSTPYPNWVYFTFGRDYPYSFIKADC